MSMHLPPRALRAWIYSFIAAIVLAGAGDPFALASEVRETLDFRDVESTVEFLVDRFGAHHVLLVLDIDNTILAMNHELGSDQWFEWQKFLVENKPYSNAAVASDFDGLLEVQGTLYNLAKMHPPQKDLPAIIGRIQELGIHTLVMTSRGPEFRVATERQLKENGYEFARSELPVHDLPGGDYLPYDLDDPAADGLTKDDVLMFNLLAPRRVNYANGVYMTAGQPKGAMLLTMLKYANPDIRAVVYVDDNIRHVAYVFAAMVRRGKEISAYHYTREDNNVKRFQYGDKDEVIRRWRKLDRTLEEVFQ